MNRINLLAFLLITLTGASIGANSEFLFKEGREPLKDRQNYCHYILSSQTPREELPRFHSTVVNSIFYPGLTEELFEHVWNQPHRLNSYRDRRLSYTHLPDPLSRHVSEKEGEILTRLRQIQSSVQLLTNQKEKLVRDPASEVQTWKLQSEIPHQLDHLRREAIRLRLQLDSLQKREFTEQELFEAYLETSSHHLLEGEKLPSLGMELRYQSSLWGDKITLHPVWVEKESAEWKVKPATLQAVFEFSGSMISPELRKAFHQQELPPSFSLYAEVTRLPLETGEDTLQPTQSQLENTEWKYIAAGRLILVGPSSLNRWEGLDPVENQWATTSTHLAVQASLDLGCLHNQTHWQERLETYYRPLIEPEGQPLHAYKHVDPRSLKTFQLLKHFSEPENVASGMSWIE